MNIEVNNVANVPNKYIRLVRWKLFRLGRKFNHLIYAKVHLNIEGNRPPKYHLMLLLGVPGNDIVLKSSDHTPVLLINKLTRSAHRYLNQQNRNNYKND